MVEAVAGAISMASAHRPRSTWLFQVPSRWANPLAIGYASLSAVGDTVKAVTVEGVECSEDTVKDGTYKIQRPFVFVTNDSAPLSEQAQAFFDFATSTDAADLIRTAGAVPVNE